MSVSVNELTPQYGWNANANRYVDLITGQFVSFVDVRNALEFNITASQSIMKALTQQLIDGTLSIADWQLDMMEQIKILHTSSAAAARGGWAQMTQSDWGFVGQKIRAQYEYLQNFALEIQNGKQLLNGSALVRAELYGQAGRGTYEDMRRRAEALLNGMTEEMRVLGEADHCEDCLNYAGTWAPINTLPRIGDSICIVNCHCKFRFRRKDGGKYVYSD